MPATDIYWRDLKKMHVWFALSAVALFGATIWMMADDHAREYFDYQRNYYHLEALRAQAKINALQTQDFLEQVAALQRKVEAAQAELDRRRDEIRQLQEAFDQAELALTLADNKLKLLRSERDVARANRDLAVRDQLSAEKLAEYQAAFDRKQKEVEQQTLLVEKLQAARDEAKQKLDEATSKLTEARKQLEEKTRDISLLRKTKLTFEPESWGHRFKRKIMEWPIIQGFNSHLHITQDWLPNLPIKLGMTETARFDRCRTCHLGINQVEAGNVPAYPHGRPTADHPPTRQDLEEWVRSQSFPHPYATHPNPDLYTTDSSPHPVTKFGCTICHDGNGSGTSFQNAEHGPNDPEQARKWKERHHYHANHFWEYPMQPKRLVESTCIKCHHSVEELGVHPKYGASAPKVFAGYRLIQQFGCFGCHEIHGSNGGKPIGPDLRLEPNYAEAALQLRWLLQQREKNGDGPTATGITLKRLAGWLDRIIREPEDSADARHRITQAVQRDAEAKRKAVTALGREKLSAAERRQQRAEIESDYLSAEAVALIDLLKDVENPGLYRKVGPSLRHLAHKVPPEFIPYWIEEPKRFRPTTRMPQFFRLSNLQDAHGRQFSAVELMAITAYLSEKSQPLELLHPSARTEKPDAARGRKYFQTKGCLACHSRGDVKGTGAHFGPDLTLLAAKIKRDAGNPAFSSWLYTWIREPQRHHRRTRMPHLFLDPESQTVTVDGKKKVVYYDPAADITAFLLQESDESKRQQQAISSRAQQLRTEAAGHVDDLLRLYLRKMLTHAQLESLFRQRKYPVADLSRVKGDEIELAAGTAGERPDDAQWEQIKLRYLGRKTISRYGCYACHDIPGFERSRPIGTTLQNWGRKERSQLAFEHIVEYLQHHGEPNGSSTAKRARLALYAAKTDTFPNEAVKERELSATFFYDRLLHHERPGFIWQKLRQPRSYDYQKIQTKGYDERLRMPKFPLNEHQIEQIVTFVLGLVAEPPPEPYLYRPSGPAAARIQGERLLNKYNCTGCHMVELPEVTLWADLTNPTSAFYAPTPPRKRPKPLGHEMLLRLLPPQKVDISITRVMKNEDEEEVTKTRLTFRGLRVFDPDEDPARIPGEPGLHYFNNWDHLDINGTLVEPSSRQVRFSDADLLSLTPGRGGTFAEWLFRYIKDEMRKTTPQFTPKESNTARHRLPPVLYREGYKAQTPWLYHFLRNPHPIRPMAVLRMPRFNMSAADARALANYFAAADGLPYPYQDIPQRRPEYIAEQDRKYRSLYPPDAEFPDYLSQAWKMLVNEKFYCRGCHSVGGYAMQKQPGSSNANVQGPDLGYATDRLRPDWLYLWLANPQWVTPYTLMPVNFKPAKIPELRQFKESFGGIAAVHLQAARDALMNYHMLLEKHKTTQFRYPWGVMPAGSSSPAVRPGSSGPKPQPKPQRKQTPKKAIPVKKQKSSKTTSKKKDG